MGVWLGNLGDKIKSKDIEPFSLMSFESYSHLLWFCTNYA